MQAIRILIIIIFELLPHFHLHADLEGFLRVSDLQLLGKTANSSPTTGCGFSIFTTGAPSAGSLNWKSVYHAPREFPLVLFSLGECSTSIILKGRITLVCLVTAGISVAALKWNWDTLPEKLIEQAIAGVGRDMGWAKESAFIIWLYSVISISFTILLAPQNSIFWPLFHKFGDKGIANGITIAS